MRSWYPFGRMARALSAAIAILVSTGATAHAAPEAAAGVAVGKWAAGLAGPQGLVLDGKGHVLVVEHDAGRVVRLPVAGGKPEVVAEKLAAPSFALRVRDATFVAERKGNSIAKVVPGAPVVRLAGEIVDPLGLALDPRAPDALLAVSHRSSRVQRWTIGKAAPEGKLSPEPVVAPEGGSKYGWRDLVGDQQRAVGEHDEVARAVLRRKPGGKLEPWAQKLSSPSGLAVSPSNEIFVTEEGTGQLTRIAPDGKTSMVARGLGAAREVLFVDAKTALVSDRKGGDVWKLTLP